MNIFKKTVACLAAATVMTSMAVTASAEYKVSGVNGDDGKYYLRIVGLPEQFTNAPDPETHPTGVLGRLYVNPDTGNTLFFTVYMIPGEGTATCVATVFGVQLQLPCSLMKFEEFGNEWGVEIEFDCNKKEIAVIPEVLSEWGVLYVSAGLCDTVSDGTSITPTGDTEWLFSDGSPATNDNAWEEVSVTFEKVNGTAPNESNSEPTSSEPANEPTSSEPESEPVSSEPVSEPAASEPVSSETTASQPSNVDTGTAGVAAIVGTAVLAAGAVIMTRKKK